MSLSNDGVDLPAAAPKLDIDPGVWRRLTKELVRASSVESVDGAWSLEEPQMATSERYVGKGDGACMAAAVAAAAAICVPWALFRYVLRVGCGRGKRSHKSQSQKPSRISAAIHISVVRQDSSLSLNTMASVLHGNHIAR